MGVLFCEGLLRGQQNSHHVNEVDLAAVSDPELLFEVLGHWSEVWNWVTLVPPGVERKRRERIKDDLRLNRFDVFLFLPVGLCSCEDPGRAEAAGGSRCTSEQAAPVE